MNKIPLKISGILVIFLLILSLSFLGIEFGLRVFHVNPPIFKIKISTVKFSADPVLGYELDPESDEVNSLGIHQGEVTLSKPPDVKRILVVGDSVSYGWSGDHPETSFVPRLAPLLEQHFPDQKWEVINGGVIGYNTIQEAELFRTKLKKLQPDLVIFQVTLNDWQDKASEFDDLVHLVPTSDQPIFRTFYQTKKAQFLSELTRYSLTWQWIKYFSAVQYVSHLAAQNTDSSSAVLGATTTETSPPWVTSDIIPTGLDEFKKNITTEKVLVVLIPDFTEPLEPYSQQYEQEHTYLHHLFDERKLEYVDLLECLQLKHRTDTEAFSSSTDTVHPNAHGYQVTAECLDQYLIGHPAFLE